LKKTLIASAAILVILTGVVYFYLFNPTETSFALHCPFKQLTGWSCAGCGMQRFLHALMHGRFLEAISYNYILIILIPYSILYGLERFIYKGEAQEKLRKIVEGNYAIYTLCAIGPIWIIVRNILNI
jgi:hypothetical protein